MAGSRRSGSAGAILLGVVIALPIAWFNLRSHLANALQSESRTGTISRAAQRLRHGFIVAQIALAFVLLAGAALLGLSLKKVMAVSPGFRADHVLTGQFTLPFGKYPDESPERVALLDRLLEAIGQQPGVAAAGTITNVPLSGDDGKSAVTPKGYVPRPGESVHGHYSYGVTGDYFTALGIPLREGRFLTSADCYRAKRVCVVDEDFARRYWPKGGGGGALGQRVFQGNDSDDAKLFTIVGVVGAVKQAELTEPQGQGAVYLPFPYQDANGNIFVVTRTSQRPEAFVGTLRKLVRATDPELALDDVRSMETRIDDSLIDAAFARVARRDFRRRGAAPGRDRNLRRLELRGRATPPRDRHPHGARRANATDRDAIPLVRPAPSCRWNRPRFARRVAGRKSDAERSLRRASAAYRHSSWHRPRHDHCVTRGLPHPRASCLAG